MTPNLASQGGICCQACSDDFTESGVELVLNEGKALVLIHPGLSYMTWPCLALPHPIYLPQERALTHLSLSDLAGWAAHTASGLFGLVQFHSTIGRGGLQTADVRWDRLGHQSKDLSSTNDVLQGTDI
ncbi:unnamed protein product [Lota lota]